jgi:hypothetical protein
VLRTLGTVADPPALDVAHAGQAVTPFLLLHAFSSGTTALTGVEAISNGVSAFKQPQARNARTTLVGMAAIMAFLFIGITFLATRFDARPFTDGNPTLVAQLAQHVLGNPAAFIAIQVATLLILVLAANTSFSSFPLLASFAADDAILPRQLRKRGHRLVYSNGILALSAAATWVLRTVDARVQRRFRDKVTIALEAHVARLQASVQTVAHQERPEWLDRLTVLREQVFVLDHMYMSLFSTAGWILRLAVTVGLLVSISPLLAALNALDSELADDFVVAAGPGWNLSAVEVQGEYLLDFAIVLNNLAGLAWTTGEIRMTSDGSPYARFQRALRIGRLSMVRDAAADGARRHEGDHADEDDGPPAPRGERRPERAGVGDGRCRANTSSASAREV